MSRIRILVLADSHIGFDLPLQPRVHRRRRGHDILENYRAALAPALNGEVDVVVHGGDVFDRPRVTTSIAWQALEPLARVARCGVPVFVVPGNHERSILPHHALAEGVHVFDRPRTFHVDVRGVRVALSGFPCERRNVRTRFPELLAQTGWNAEDASRRLLCIHQCVEGATVGPGDFTFTTAQDVIRARDLPAGFAAVLSGHIHRHQVLTADLRGGPVAAPVLYPGSLERLSLAEIGEPKGYVVLEVDTDSGDVRWEFRPLPTRPMIVRDVQAAGLTPGALHDAVRAIVAQVPEDAVLRVRISGDLTRAQLQAIAASRLRAFVPASMNLEIRTADGNMFQARAARRRARTPDAQPEAPLQLELG